MSGFAIQGCSAPASCLGTFEAESFEEACKIACKDDPNYDPVRNTSWGCKLYDNERDARKRFG